MAPDNLNLDSSLIKEAIQIFSDSTGLARKAAWVEQLSLADRRNLLLRISLEGSPKGGPESFILKQVNLRSDISGVDAEKDLRERFNADWVGAEFLTSIGEIPHGPRFYGGSLRNRFILLEDLGKVHRSLVGPLLKTGNTQGALAALGRFARRAGAMHADSFGKMERYLELCKKRNYEVLTSEEKVREGITEKIPAFLEAIAPVYENPSEKLVSELQHVMESNLSPGPFHSFLHGDICPDNVFDLPEQSDLRLIDFEFGHIGNALLDATYPRMSMPTCWCSKALPNYAIEEFENTYRRTLALKIPAAGDDTIYFTQYVNACAGWIVMSLIWSLKSTLKGEETCPSGPVEEDSEWKPEGNLFRPRLLSRLRAFIEVSEQHDRLPHLRSATISILTLLEKRWSGVSPLDYFPAFSVAKGVQV